MSKLVFAPEWVKSAKLAHGIFDDFHTYTSGDIWTPLVTDLASSATAAILPTTGGAGGILSIANDATDNDEVYWVGSNKPVLFAADKPAYCEIRMQYSEGATDDLNVIFGFLSTGAADTLIDNGGGPVASATMAVIYKVDGGTVWRMRSQIGAAVGQTDSISTSTAGGAAYQTLGVEFLPYSSTTAKIVYTIDGVPFRDSNNLPITHNLVYTNAVVCGPVFGIKAGSATAETLLVDYCGYCQAR